MASSWRAFLLFLLASGCRQTPGPSPAILADAGRQLEERGRADQAVREGFGTAGFDSAQGAAMARTDSANTSWLKAYVARWGWPAAAQVGRDAVQAAFLIVQHAVHDTAFMRSMLPFIEDAHRLGDLDGGAVAMLTDRVEVKAGRPQIYGTQLSLKDGRWVFDPIADSADVDARRRKTGLPPLAEYRRLVDSVLQPGALPASRRMADGKQWLTDNLKVATDQSYCYQDAEQNCRRYSRLYTWESARRGCHSLGAGWRLPTDDEWRQMAKHYGGVGVDAADNGRAAYRALVTGGSSGFNAVLGGNRSVDGRYARSEAHGFYWTASDNGRTSAPFYNFGKGGQALYRQSEGEKLMAVSVRCVRD